MSTITLLGDFSTIPVEYWIDKIAVYNVDDGNQYELNITLNSDGTVIAEPIE